MQVDEALGVDEDADRRSVGRRGIEVRLRERVDTVALTRLCVEANVVAQAGARGVSWMPFCSGVWPSAVSSVKPASGDAGSAGLGA
jgi:hypothetical protein